MYMNFSAAGCVSTQTHFISLIDSGIVVQILCDQIVKQVKQVLRKYPIPEILLLYSGYQKVSEDKTSTIICKNVLHLEPNFVCLCLAFHLHIQMKPPNRSTNQ